MASWSRDCVACQCAKVTKQPWSSIQPITISQGRFSHVHVDLVGPLPASEDGFLYLLTMVDRTTRWLEAVTPLRTWQQPPVWTLFLLHGWHVSVCPRFTSERGTQFASATWAFFCTSHGVKHVMTTAYHPQASNLV